jgi:hypothetical protein
MPPVTSVRLLPERIARTYRKHIELMDQRRKWHDIIVTLCLCHRVKRQRRHETEQQRRQHAEYPRARPLSSRSIDKRYIHSYNVSTSPP